MRANNSYKLDLLDTVSVIECNTKSNTYSTVYKIERRCKHSNIQFIMSAKGVEPVCDKCGLVMIKNRIEEAVDEKR